MSWNQGFGVDSAPDDGCQSLRDLCYPIKKDEAKPKIKLLIDKRKFYCAQLKGIKTHETKMIDMVELNPKIALLIIEFIAYEREFIENMKTIEREIIPTFKDTKYSRVEKIRTPLRRLIDSHSNFLMTVESIFVKNVDESIFDKFVSLLVGDGQIVSAHQEYMNCFLSIETLASSYSVDFSEKFYEHLGNKTAIQLFRLPIPWQNNTYDFSMKLGALIPEDDVERRKGVDDFATQIKLLSESIDCIPQLEAISKMFVTEPFPIVVGGRRILKRGTASKHCRSNITKREIILFSDIFMYAQLKCGKYLAPAEFELATMEVLIEEPDQKLLSVFAPKKSFVLQFNTIDERNSWYQIMKQAIEDAQSTYEGNLEKVEHAPIWYADSTQEVCMECKKPFNPITRRRHHCRICGRVLCAECVSNKIIIPNISTTKPEKVCDKCYKLKKEKEK